VPAVVIHEPESDNGPGMKTPTLESRRILNLLFVALLPGMHTAGCTGDSVDPETEDGQLLFNLSEDELLAIHDTYLADEDLELTRARLTAPFDCDLYDDLCAEVGRDAAIELTAQQVDLALEGASLATIEAELWHGVAEASALWSELPDDEEQFRGSGDWAIRTKDPYRLKVQNGITTPLMGDRKAWTEAKLQKQDWLGVWSSHQADLICVNTGTNEQVMEVGGNGIPTSYTTLESSNPAQQCETNNSIKDETFHDRNNGSGDPNSWTNFEITARGCGTADIDGVHLGICADDYVETF
jgi:hypothetical protein